MSTFWRSLLAGCLPVAAALWLLAPVAVGQGTSEAPTGFDGLTNGFTSQAQFDEDREEFVELQTIDEGLGPVYNAQSCGECHQNPTTGAISQGMFSQ